MIARVLMAAAATLLPLTALAQEAAAPADAAQPAVVERAKPQQRGFSIARMGSKPAPATKKAGAVAPAKMADGDMKDDAAPGKMTKHHTKRHHRHHMRHHHAKH